MKTYFVLLSGLLMACHNHTDQSKRPVIAAGNVAEDASVYHGYNELADPEKREHLTISDYNTDNPSISNIDRPEESLIKTSLDTSLLFKVWTADPEAPHAAFVFSGESFFVQDYDGDGEMPYTLTDRMLTVYYNDFIQEGRIVSLDKDTLKIQWKDMEKITVYSEWNH